MSELAITLLRLGYLVLLWVFVLSTIGVLRRDLYGTKITARGGPAKKGRTPTPAGGTAALAPPTPARRDAAPTRLVVTEGPLRGTTLPLTTSAILIGRAPSCTLVLDDDYSSSRHARIFPQGTGWFVEDLGSTNGTFLDTTKVERPTPIPPGAHVRIGQSVVELQR
ncbi:FHA domain-containing protein FhaB/FipA [Pengzhenrongella frigida]|uniref:FHA domain-containing protein n=1 Tax=Pengzhenrongella frigida TaxID=1259133 RepID=A0A4Q5N194_9MICO|nr:FHA domain-containing protein [Cellulomonas sp. HLT2-17]RYV51839.1 FHA domain-containing protein [Cellulomonas sp. HLT2-17]